MTTIESLTMMVIAMNYETTARQDAARDARAMHAPTEESHSSFSRSDAATKTWDSPMQVISNEASSPVFSNADVDDKQYFMSITPRVLLLEVTLESRNQNSLPSLRTNHRRRQVRTTSPRFINHPARAGSRQNSTPPVS